MNAPPSAAPGKKRPWMLVLGWTLLVASILLCFAGPRLSISDVPSDIKNRMGDADWIAFAWIIGGIVAGALAVMCFAVEWARRPERQGRAHQQDTGKSK